MPPSSRIPPLLHPYIKLPKHDSITLTTSVLGASANWLLVRFICEALSAAPGRGVQNGTQDGLVENTETEGEGEDLAVVLVSWMREWEFWRGEARKGCGLDLVRLAKEGRFVFVDGLSKLYLPEMSGSSTHTPTTVPLPAQTILPVRTPGRIGPIPNRAQPSPQPQTEKAKDPGRFYLTSPDLKLLKDTIRTAISSLSSRKTLLILDSPDALLSTAASPTLTSFTLSSTLLALHDISSHILIHLSADTPLLSPSSPPLPLELDSQAFLVKVAHITERVLSCRVLDTGVARDVSGVLRCTVRDGGYFEGEGGGELEGKEMLYLVKGDGSVKVFERGAGEGH
ncbi:hypothetical protein K469DRAFT_700306 [Zopfia rhizophila CBS 207.26]|uniref:Elongator complex protein 6 n=1 Tax=Zopfia rhizophila CBS 207.26 TaxID=1314779 RepID=A0A6A6D9M7_9PEZI|nr:hypothetical protein K469DRAFT_700306 [Zopfia rhizophila CBS 207.26]